MYIKVILLSLVLALPMVALSALIEYGVTIAELLEPKFWLSHIFAVSSYGVVTALVLFLFGSLGGESSSESGSKPSSKKGNKEQGKVKWFNSSKGYGFITRDQGDDVFVHYRSIAGKGHRSLYEGQVVEFSVSDGDKGLQANDVVIISGEAKPRRRRSR